MSPEPWRDVILQSNDFVTIFITMNPFHKSDNHQLQLFAARFFLIKFKLKTKQQHNKYLFCVASAHSLGW